MSSTGSTNSSVLNMNLTVLFMLKFKVNKIAVSGGGKREDDKY